MSGHSHAKTVKRIKEAEAKKRGKAFSKMARVIIMAAREGGGDPANNSKLKLAIEQAKQINMPKENIERAIRRGTGGLDAEKLEAVVFEAYGPAKTAIIIEGITDNKNRTLAEIKQILNQYNGKLATEGSVKWMFERKGVITINNEQKTMNKDNLEMEAIDAGADDIHWHGDILNIYTKPEELEKVKKNLEEKGIKVESSSLDWVAKNMIDVEEKEKESCQKLFEALNENEAVQNIYSNLKI